MSDSIQFGYPFLWDQILKWAVVLQRPAVQGQLLAIAIAVLAAKLISKWVWKTFRRRFASTNYSYRQGQKRSWTGYGTLLLHLIFTPLLSIVVISLFKVGFRLQGWVTGLLLIAAALFWVFLLLRVCIGVLYGVFPTHAVNRLQYQLTTPLFFLFAIGSILSLQSDLQQLANVVLFELFGGSITLGDCFLTTFGLYFWVVSVFFLERFLQFLITAGARFKASEWQAVSLIIRYVLIFLGIVFIFGYVGFSPAAFAAITGGLSVGVGFGLREVISNFVSGIWLLFEGALKPGDIVNVGGEVGEVQHLGIRAATVRVLRDGSEKILPNQTFFTNEVTTYTGSDRLVSWSLTVGVSYTCNPKTVIDLLLKIADQHPSVLKDPSPLAFFLEFGESSLNFELKFWLTTPRLTV
ncbi:MAG: mechanosensitive ion channel, partial [Pseudanabaenales cyanobacterium]|nr:mechanosensitive ion channel [Pseudanabaenales cyanobacterium]